MTKRTLISLFTLLLINSILNVNAVFANNTIECKTENAKNTNKTASSFRPFITTWQTTTSKTIKVPMSGTYIIDWGDGSAVDTITGSATHIYASWGTKTISITGGATRIDFGSVSDSKDQIYDITQWGDIVWGSDLSNAFYQCENLDITATDTPDLSNTTNLSQMFSGAKSLNADLSLWDVSNVTNMSSMFEGADLTYCDISTWVVSKVTDMSAMFKSIDLPFINTFDISGWNVGNVINMSSMFSDASNFNSDLSNWDVSKVTDMNAMFLGATSFNSDLSLWIVGNVSNMSNMFSGAKSLNADLSLWDVSKVTNMSHMFNDAILFNAQLYWWNVEFVTNMSGMFSGASVFNRDLSYWNVANVTDMSNMFNNSGFRGGLNATAMSNWNVSNVTNMSGMFHGVIFYNPEISNWDVSKVTDMNAMFNGARHFNSDISNWDVSSVTDMSSMFSGAEQFNSDISNWDVSKVTDMNAMFNGARHFNSDISNWDVSSVTDMSSMFYLSLFNGDISNWDVSNVTNMSSMFKYASSFNSDISNWDVSNVTDMGGMFFSAGNFNQNLSSWDISLLNLAENIFQNVGFSSDNYDSILIGWAALPTVPYSINLGTVTVSHCLGAAAKATLLAKGWTINDLGLDCAPFITTWQTTTANEEIKIPMTGTYTIDWGDNNTETITDTAIHTYATANTYNVSIGYGATKIDFSIISDSKDKIKAITQWGDLVWGADLSTAFYDCTQLNITATDTPDLTNTTNLSNMFLGATSLQGDLSLWDVSNVNNMSGLFLGATAFNSDLSLWDVSNVTNMNAMFYGATSFNTDLSNWDVSKVSEMYGMFFVASVFNSDISNWNVSKVTNMGLMFHNAYAFNSDISNWDVSKVTDMSSMLSSTNAFNQDLSSWDISSVTNATGIFNNTNLSTKNYDKLLIGWAALATVSNNIDLGILTLKHCVGVNAKAVLETKGWTINDGGLSTNCNAWTGTTDTDWATTTNWSAGSLPLATSEVVIQNVTNKPIINSNTTALTENLTLLKNATLEINASGGLTINGNFSSADSNALTANSGSSVIATGTSNNNITYNRTLPTTNWYLVSAPFSNETIENFINSNNLATGSTNMGVINIGLAPYNNAVASNNWNYQNTNSVGTFNTGKGYAVKLAAPGDIAFSGVVNATSQTQTITQSVNDFNLVGNPFAAYLNLGDFFTDNTASGILSEATAWFWNQNTNTYEPKTSIIDGSFEIAPAQGFFLSAGSSSTTVTFDATDLSHQSTDAFQKTSDDRPQIKLFMNDGTNHRTTRIFYIEGATTGFDNGYDGTLFGGLTNSLQVYSQLVTDDSGAKLGVQVLPNSGYEDMVIPLGVTAPAGKELRFYAEFLNLPSGIQLYLEDRFTNTFVPLEANNDNFKVTLTESLDGVGRFYLHTSSNALSSNENLPLASIQVFKSSSKTLKLVGLPSGKSDLNLYTMQGKKVHNSSFKESGTKEISLADLATGIYLIQLETVYGKLNKKIVLH